jgi:hypothetical protein
VSATLCALPLPHLHAADPPPQFQTALDSTRLTFGFYRLTPEGTALASAPMDPLALECRDEDEAIRQFEDQGIVADTSSDSDDEDPGFHHPHRLLCHLVHMITMPMVLVLLLLLLL